MPKWPAYVMGAFALACAYPAITASAPVAESEHAAPAKPALERAMEPAGVAEVAAVIAAKG
jgi:hypothetical protein